MRVLSLAGKRYIEVLIRLGEKDQHERPKYGTFLYDEQVVNVRDGDEYLITLVPYDMAQRHRLIPRRP